MLWCVDCYSGLIFEGVGSMGGYWGTGREGSYSRWQVALVEVGALPIFKYIDC
jgi:hypothetical protein